MMTTSKANFQGDKRSDRCSSGEDVVNGECIARTCEPHQIILEGKCLDRAAIGESCKSSLQCISNSRCVSGRCGCGKGEKPDGNNCVKVEEEVTKASRRSGDVCTEPEQPYFEKGTARLRYCSQTADDCPKGYSCQYSEMVCWNRASKCHCPSNMTPYLLNGKPKSCSSGTCPYGFECKFSSSKKNYFCCSKVWSTSSHLRKDGGCERGSALLYPATQEPVHCDTKTRGCPHGYLCLPHSETKVLQCCSVESEKDMSMFVDTESKHSSLALSIRCN
ncbi:EB module [Oesophagostomum dentatum]|uniref:EB module n=1 Tax=Oesophagostomum dentatum TaxID=61180 RepID=A0A0B1T9G4_OESDE|nr:EB module [Oesophagostomum dentatum]